MSFEWSRKGYHSTAHHIILHDTDIVLTGSFLEFALFAASASVLHIWCKAQCGLVCFLSRLRIVLPDAHVPVALNHVVCKV